MDNRDRRHRAGAPALEARGLGFAYPGAPVLQDLSFAVPAGQRVAVIGPNGAGKSTLFKLVAGLLRPTAGELLIGGLDSAGHICVAYLPQRSQMDWRFPLCVREVVMMGRTSQIGWFRRPGAEDRAHVARALARVRMEALADRPIDALSGGQQQRMFIARALAQQAGIILLDEPFNGLDPSSRADVMETLDRLRSDGVTVLMATHDLGPSLRAFDRVLLLHHRLEADGPPAETLASPALAQAFSFDPALLA
jgi:ABC-type Mn2+/Zn2+ transport system ATPase subunit